MHGKRIWKDRILKPKVSKKDRCSRVELWNNGKHKTILVHRLVANAFLQNNINSKMTVNHKDGNRLNNSVANLEWITRAENIKYGFENGQYSTCKKCILIKDNKEYEFISQARANKFLNRSCGYIYSRIKRKQFIAIDNKGEKYLIKN